MKNFVFLFLSVILLTSCSLKSESIIDIVCSIHEDDCLTDRCSKFVNDIRSFCNVYIGVHKDAEENEDAAAREP